MVRHPFKPQSLSLRDLQEEINGLFDRLWHGGIRTGPFDGQEWAPPVDVLDESERFVVRAEVPGLVAADFDVSVSGNVLTIKGNKPSDRREEQQEQYVRAERPFGAFNRSITLPVAVNADGVRATCSKGVLEVSLPKSEEARPKSVRVEVQGGQTA